MRLFTSQGSGNFVEVDAAEIASVDMVPDPPAAPVTTAEPKLTNADVHQLIARAGAQHNLDVDLLASVVRAESGGNTLAVSRAGAQGLMQLMPQTAAQLGVADSFRPDQNIKAVRPIWMPCWFAITTTWRWRWPPIMPGRRRSRSITACLLIAKPGLCGASDSGVQSTEESKGELHPAGTAALVLQPASD